MVTRASKPVSRVTSAVIRDGGKRRELVLTIYPNGMIGLRPKGTRREETANAEGVWFQALRARVASELAAKKLARKNRR